VVPKRRSGLAGAVVTALVAISAVQVWEIVALLHRADFAARLQAHPTTISLGAARAADRQVRLSAEFGLVGLAVTGILFIIWLHQIVTDLHRLRPGRMRYGPGWAIGGWFVPFLNLARPKQVVDDAWRSSAPPGRYEPGHPMLRNLWWFTYLVQGVVFLVVRDIGAGNGSAASGLAGQDRTSACGYGISIIAAVLAILVVRALTDRVAQVPAHVHPGAPPTGTRFNPPPGWPAAPPGWTPPLGWAPDPAWPPAPADWQFWTAPPDWNVDPPGALIS
jgi:hypothetical protein